MLCAASVVVLGQERRCHREGLVDLGPVALCWQHAAEVERHYRRELRVHALEDDVYRLRTILAEQRLDAPGPDSAVTEHEGPCVYFAVSPLAPGLIKIGHTTNLAKRMVALGARAVAVIPGTVGDEAHLHRRFADLRWHGEWFICTSDLSEFIAEQAA
jgi:Meiotically Up-regulated Gene 113 (MUG113) protein